MSEVDQYKAHLFVCLNAKDGFPCCANKNAEGVHKALKERFKAQAKEKKVRINKSGCLDRCAQGVVAVLYPQGKWYKNLNTDNLSEVISDIDKLTN
jgi:(2Fe-2S) ferredoxin